MGKLVSQVFESLSQSLSVYPPIKLLISELFILPVGPGCSELRSDPLVHSLIAGGKRRQLERESGTVTVPAGLMLTLTRHIYTNAVGRAAAQ